MAERLNPYVGSFRFLDCFSTHEINNHDSSKREYLKKNDMAWQVAALEVLNDSWKQKYKIRARNVPRINACILYKHEHDETLLGPY